MSEKQPVAAVGVVCLRGDEVLLVRRGKAPREGEWSLPGGRIEWGERVRDAALRELKEETGVDAEILGFAGWREMVLRGDAGKPARHFVILAFAARWRAGEIAPSPELSDARWIRPDELDGFETTEGLAEIVAEARRIVDK